MTPEQLAEKLSALVHECIAKGAISLAPEDVPEMVQVTRPKTREHGDWATNIAMQLGKKAGMSPRDFASALVKEIEKAEGIESAEIAGPGFINIRLAAGAAGELVRTILQQGDAYGTSKTLEKEHVNLEYVSANPTGPVHLGGARWAAVGDTLSRLIMAQGAKVTREYYFNDHGAQIDRFAVSLLARARGQEVPEDGYGGQYIDDIANRVKNEAIKAGLPDPATLPDAEAEEYFRKHGVELMFAEIKNRLHDFRTDFDVYFHEASLHESGAVHKAVDILRKRGVIYDEGGAVWLKTTDFGDDKDRVLFKSNGEAAYFSADVAYYLDKRSRGSTCSIYLLGADHHGYVGRMLAMCAAFGDTPNVNMQILIGQMVNLFKDGEPVRMSKRAGTIVTLDDFVEAVGVDAARYSLVRSSMDSQLDINLDLLASNTNENPVYYVQYAHARTCSVARNADEAGVTRDMPFDPAQLNHEADATLLGVLAQFPATLALAAEERATHRVPRYLETLAGAYHAWYNQCRVTPRADETVDASHVARRHLNDAVTQVLATGLSLIAVSAPERM
ncbi:MAG: arginine--tRNA ligase [Actinomycetaceae bacterium]|nr:arginine--tRNA ligase [Actinomycetaceae bacterium]